MDVELLDEFQNEAQEMISEAEQSLIEIEKQQNIEENFNTLFRNLHSLKGAAGMFGLKKIEELAHHLENVLLSVNNKPSSEVLDYSLNGVDALREMIEGKSVDFERKDFEGNSGLDSKGSTQRTGEVVRGKVLAVDDEVAILEGIKLILEEENFEVKIMQCPQAALEEIPKYKPDCIFSDIKMPKMNGLEFLSNLKKIDPDVSVTLVSGFVDMQSCLKAIEYGAYKIIQKPFDHLELISVAVNTCEQYKVRKLLNQSVNFILYQFSDLQNYLKEKGRDDLYKKNEKELKNILKMRKLLRNKS